MIINNQQSYGNSPSFKGITKYVVKAKDYNKFNLLLNLNLIKEAPDMKKSAVVIENPFFINYLDYFQNKITNKHWVIQHLKQQGKNVEAPKGINPDDNLSVYLFTEKDAKKYQKKYTGNIALIKQVVSMTIDSIKNLPKRSPNFRYDIFENEKDNFLLISSINQKDQKKFEKFLANKKIDSIEFDQPQKTPKKDSMQDLEENYRKMRPFK